MHARTEQRAMPAMDAGAAVAVTGASGYLGSHLVLTLLQRGHIVHACVRDTADEAKVGFLRRLPGAGEQLKLFSCDMTVPGAYDSAFSGVHAVFHPAAVVGLFAEDPTRDIYLPAMTGNRKLVASIERSQSVRRLVYTSSTASLKDCDLDAIKAELKRPDYLFKVDESRLPDPTNSKYTYEIMAYHRSKVDSERMFRDAAVQGGGRWDLVVGAPADILGPILSPLHAQSGWQSRLGMLMQGNEAAATVEPWTWFTVDVRDCAAAQVELALDPHIRPFTHADGGKYLLCSTDRIYVTEIAEMAQRLYPQTAVATEVAPKDSNPSYMFQSKADDLVRYSMMMDNSKVCAAVNMRFRTLEETVRDTIEALVKVGGLVLQPRKPARL